MKLKIKVLLLNTACEPVVQPNGEWIDLRAAKDINLTTLNTTPSVTSIPLGVAMQLPKGFEAIIASRSSIFSNFGGILTNSIGIIDNSYSGNNDEWKYQLLSFRPTNINIGDRLCQFRIQLSQKSTILQKIKWLLSSGIKIEYVTDLNSINRGGFGTSGK